jgi:uncharacterized protein (DUF885 family)
MDSQFEQLGRRYVDEVTALSPVSATWLGDHRFDDQLDEVTPEARQRQAAFYCGILDRLDQIPRDELSRANQIDAAMLRHRLRAGLWRLEHLQEWAWDPMAYTGLAGNAVYSLMARDFAPVRQRLKDATSRLAEFPRLMQQVRKTLEPQRVPKVHAETAVKQNPGIVRMLDEMVEPRASALSSGDRSRLAEAMTTARAAVEDHQRWLEGELLPQAAGDFRLGPDLYDTKLAFTLQTPLARRDIRERAESELRRTRAEMLEIAADLGPKTRPHAKGDALLSRQREQTRIGAALEMAYRDMPDRDRIVDEARAALARATAFVRDARLVTLPPDPVEVIVMPEFRRGRSLAYCDSPGPLDVGRRTFYAISPAPADWTEEQVRSLLREYNRRSLANLTVHEAMPGHFLQLTHSNRYPSTLRAMLASGVFIEGWAVYTERMMADEGFYDGDPLARLIVLKWYLRGIANALLDQAIHVEGMTEDQAMRLMMEETFQQEREAAGKWVRAQLTSTQLTTYFVGALEHASLRREMEAAWAGEFDLKRYHDTVLSFGSPPVQYVRALALDLPIEPA